MFESYSIDEDTDSEVLARVDQVFRMDAQNDPVVC